MKKTADKVMFRNMSRLNDELNRWYTMNQSRHARITEKNSRYQKLGWTLESDIRPMAGMNTKECIPHFC